MTPPDSLCNRLTIPEFAPTEAVTSLFNRNTNLAASRFLNSRRLKPQNQRQRSPSENPASRFLNSRRLKREGR